MRALLFVASSILALSSITAPSQAAVVVSPGAPVVFNFAASKPGTYNSVEFSSGIDFCSVLEGVSYCPGSEKDQGSMRFYTGQNGTGTEIGWIDNSLLVWDENNFLMNLFRSSAPPAVLLDGFSVVYEATEGSITIGTPSIGYGRAGMSSVGVFAELGSLTSASVPEGGSLALVLAGLSALVGIRRRSLA